VKILLQPVFAAGYDIALNPGIDINKVYTKSSDSNNEITEICSESFIPLVRGTLKYENKLSCWRPDAFFFHRDEASGRVAESLFS
jgi:hypothetical protein